MWGTKEGRLTMYLNNCRGVFLYFYKHRVLAKVCSHQVIPSDFIEERSLSDVIGPQRNSIKLFTCVCV